MRFEIRDQAVLAIDDDRTITLSDRPLEIVSISDLDQRLYLRWPADHRHHHMAAMPVSLLERPGSELREWAERSGLPLSRGAEIALGRFLTERIADWGP